MILNRHILTNIDPVTLYELLRLRVDVFVVEQNCPYPELDGRDLEPNAELWWLEDDGRVVATLRVLTEPSGERRIGRVATRIDRRGGGLAARMIRTATDELKGPLVLDAQSHLHDWYAEFGFAQDGPEFVEDGIDHIPMRRPAAGHHC